MDRASRPVLPRDVGDAREAQLDRDAPSGVVVDQGRRLLVQAPGLRPFRLDEEQVGKPRQRLGPFDRAIRPFDEVLERSAGACDVATRDLLIRGEREAAADRESISGRRQIDSALQQRSRRVWRTATHERQPGILERLGHVTVRLDDGAGQVMRTLLGIGRDVGQPAMDLASARLGHAGIGRGRKERMTESDRSSRGL